ncbi:MAG: phosphatase PAP2 family protein [Flavobacteriales bacterium]
MKNYKLDNKVINNFYNTRFRLLFPPILLLLVIIFIFLKKDAFNVYEYIEIQKDLFFYLNSRLSKLPHLQFNLTQLGDALIFLPLFTVFIIYAPKLWDTVITSSIIAGVLSILLKRLFVVPRPAAIFDNDSFVIIGKTIASTHSSLPSGHSIITFTLITILLFAFMPKELKSKIFWTFILLSLGLIIAFSRVGVGAHYPFDVVIGSTIGYISALIGIFINNKVNLWPWYKNKKYHPILMLLLIIWIFTIISKIIINNLLIFYFSLVALIITLYLIIDIYVKK